ncbi:MAG: adenylate kinase family protein [Candidatus Methanomethylophilaceae archaeon]|jgi:adenylate kinase
MPLIAITGTPGTGKTSVSEELRSRGYKVVDINRHLREHGLLGEKDVPRDTYEVDLDALNDSLTEIRDSPDTVFMDSHLSHCLDCHAIIVLRCDPKVLAERLKARGYSEAKVTENVQAELLDVILCEATDSDIPVYEIDCTSGTASDTADTIVGIINGMDNDHSPGKINWTGEMEEWF